MVPGAGLEPARPYERGILNFSQSFWTLIDIFVYIHILQTLKSSTLKNLWILFDVTSQYLT
jgi:hypothetical protein